MHVDLSVLPEQVGRAVVVMVEEFSASLGVVPTTSSTLEAIESGLLASAMQLVRSAMGAALQSMDLDVAGIVVGEKAYRRTGRSPLSVVTLAGTVDVEQTTYRARGGHGGETVGAIGQRAGLVGGTVTTGAAALICECVAQMTPVATKSVLDRIGVVGVSTSTLDRVPKRVGELLAPVEEAVMESVRVAEIATLPSAAMVARVSVSLDGVMVPMKEAARAPESDDDSSRQAYREASSAVFQLLDPEGNALHVIRLGCMPEAHKTKLYRHMLAELEAVRLRYPHAPVQALADGAAENWRILGTLQKDLGISFETETVDFYHASGHLAAGLRASGATEEDIARWHETLRDQVGGAQAVLVELVRRQAKLPKRTPQSQREELRKQVTYFNNNHQRMDYAGAKAKGWPIGSGMQEAACKTLVVQRLKLSGMSWGTPGGQAILTFRGLLQSQRYALFWNALCAATQPPITPQPEPVRQTPSYARAA